MRTLSVEIQCEGRTFTVKDDRITEGDHAVHACGFFEHALASRVQTLVDLLSQARVGLGDYGNPADEVLLGQIDVALGETR